MHLTDGTLVGIIDGLPLPQEVDEDHLNRCTACQQRAAMLEARLRRLTLALDEARAAEPPPPADLWDRVRAAGDRRQAVPALPDPHVLHTGSKPSAPRPRMSQHAWKRPIRIAAALAGLLIAGSLTAESVREWLADGVVHVVTALRGGNPIPPVEADAAVSVRVMPVGESMDIQLEHSQQSGVLRVTFEERDDALAEIITSDVDADVLVLPDAFHVRNGSARNWSYRFRFPDRLSAVRIVVDGALVAALRPQQEPFELRFPVEDARPSVRSRD